MAEFSAELFRPNIDYRYNIFSPSDTAGLASTVNLVLEIKTDTKTTTPAENIVIANMERTTDTPGMFSSGGMGDQQSSSNTDMGGSNDGMMMDSNNQDSFDEKSSSDESGDFSDMSSSDSDSNSSDLENGSNVVEDDSSNPEDENGGPEKHISSPEDDPGPSRSRRRKRSSSDVEERLDGSLVNHTRVFPVTEATRGKSVLVLYDRGREGGLKDGALKEWQSKRMTGIRIRWYFVDGDNNILTFTPEQIADKEA